MNLHSPREHTADLLWELCLDIVRMRRSGRWPAMPSRYALRARAMPVGEPPAADTATDAPAGETPATAPTHDGEPLLDPVTSVTGAPLAWAPAQGWSLCGPWDGGEVELFSLLKPLLDRAPDARPWLVGHLGQSLDGRIATHTGHSCYVTGHDNLVHLHRLRALCDAVIVGAGTVAQDDPQLTTRHVPGSNATRVVLDPTLRVPPSVRVFTDEQAPTLLVCDARRADEAAQRVGAARVLAVPGLCDDDGDMALDAVVQALHTRGLSVLFVEGGGVTVSRFLARGLLDRLHLAIAPVIIGHGRPGLQLPGADTMDDCLRPPCRVFGMGADVLWDLDLGAVRQED